MTIFGKRTGDFMQDVTGQASWFAGAPDMLRVLSGGNKALTTFAKSPFGKALGPVGAVLSGISGAFNAGEAVHNFQKGGYHCDEAWNNVGGTVLGGAGAALIACPVAGAYLAAGAGAADLAGHAASWGFGKKAGFSASNIVGGLARGMYGDRSIGESVSNSLGGGFWGHAAGTATNVIASPINLARTVGSGVINEIGAIGSGIMNGEGVIGGGIHAIGSGIGSAASAIADW